MADFFVPLGSISTQLAQSKQSSEGAEDIMYYLLDWVADKLSRRMYNTWEKMFLYISERGQKTKWTGPIRKYDF